MKIISLKGSVGHIEDIFCFKNSDFISIGAGLKHLRECMLGCLMCGTKGRKALCLVACGAWGSPKTPLFTTFPFVFISLSIPQISKTYQSLTKHHSLTSKLLPGFLLTKIQSSWSFIQVGQTRDFCEQCGGNIYPLLSHLGHYYPFNTHPTHSTHASPTFPF